MSDRLLARLGSRWCLGLCAVLALAPLAIAWFSGPPWLGTLGLPFAATFGVGGAARDLGIADRVHVRPGCR